MPSQVVPDTNPALPERRPVAEPFAWRPWLSPCWEAISLGTEGWDASGPCGSWGGTISQGCDQPSLSRRGPLCLLPLCVNPNLLTLPDLTPDCSLCRMSQLSPPDLGAVTLIPINLATATAAQPQGPITLSLTPYLLLGEWTLRGHSGIGFLAPVEIPKPPIVCVLPWKHDLSC